MSNAPNISTPVLRKRILKVSVVGTLVAAVLVGAATMIPAFQRFADAHDKELTRSAELVSQSLGQNLNRISALASQSAGQFQARQAMVSHSFGEIDKDIFKVTVMPALRAIVEQYDVLKGTVRLDNNDRVVVTVGMDIPRNVWPENAFALAEPVFGNFFDISGTTHFTISMPIIDPNYDRVGTDILLMEATELLGILEPTEESAEQETFLMTRSPAGYSLFASNGMVHPDDLADIDPKGWPTSGFVRTASKDIGIASVDRTGWHILVATDADRLYVHLWEDIAKILFVAFLAMAAVGAAVYAIMSPLADGLVVHTASLEAEVSQRTAELNASEERFRGFAEAASDWFWESDTEHRFTYLSEAFYAADKVLGKTRWEVGSGAPITGSWDEHRARMDAHDPIVGFEYGVVSQDGQERFLRVNGKPVFGEDGEFLGYRGVGRNITELRLAERERDRADRLFVEAIASLPVSIALFDPDDRLLIWNRLYAEELARDLDISVGKPFEDIVRQSIAKNRIEGADEGDEEWLQKRLAQHRNPTAPFDIHLDGKDQEITEYRTDEGFTILVAHDVTQAKLAAADFRRQKDLLETVFESIPAAIYLKDRSGAYTKCNDQFVRYRQYDKAEEIIDRTIFDLTVDRAEAASVSEEDRLVMEDGWPQTDVEVTSRRRDGTQIETISSKVPLRDADGEIIGLLGIITDITERKRAEVAMAASEARFRALLDHSPNAIFLKDRDGRYLLVNKTLADRYGTSADSYVGKTARDFYPPDMAKQIEAQDRIALESGEPRTEQNEILFPDGSTHIVRTVRFPVPGADGERTALGCISRDVTKQVRAEEARQAEHTLLQTVLETIPHAVYWKNSDRVYSGCNSVYAKTCELEREDIIGRRIYDFSSDQKEADNIDKMDLEVLSGGKPLVDFEDTRTKSDGSIRVHLSSKVPLLDADGRPNGILGIFNDITERKRTEWALAESEQRFRSVTESSADAIIAVDDTGAIVSWNLGARRMFGHDALAIIGKSLTEIIPEQHIAAHKEGFARAHKMGELHLAGKTIELEGLRADGTTFPAELSLGSWKSNDRRFYSGIVRDVTVRKKTEDMLRRSQKVQSLGNLAAGMAHEINNLLLPISTLTRMTVKRLPEESAERTKLEKVLEAADRAAGIISGVMDFARQDTGKRTELDSRDVIEKSIAIIRSMLPANVTFERKLARNVGKIDVNSEGINVALSNLVTNAIDALAGKPGKLQVSLRRLQSGAEQKSVELGDGPYALIHVADSGCGMDPETVERALDPFFTTKEVGEGTGLGLSVANGIVERHGGVMHIDSTPGEGTEISIFLPLVTDQPQATNVPEPGQQSENDFVSELERKYGTSTRH